MPHGTFLNFDWSANLIGQASGELPEAAAF
jgi:hypothetical protein